MSAKLFRECRAALGLSQTALAAELWVAHRTVVYWEAGDREVPGPVWVALGFMLDQDGHRAMARRVRLQCGPRDGGKRGGKS